MNDIRFALRQLLKSPGFSVVAILTLTLGIGANVAIFSVVNAVLLRPLAFAQPDKLLWIYSSASDSARLPFSLPEFCDYRDQNTLYEGLAAVGTYNANLVDRNEAERVQGLRLSANIFQILGVRPLLGRTLVAEDDRNGAPPVAMISHSLWSRRYGRQNDVVGRSVILNAAPRTIVGILPPDFVLPNLDSEIVVPLQPDADPRRQVRTSVNFLRFVGRLKAGVTPQQAHAELDAIRQNLRRQFPDAYSGNIGVLEVPLVEEIVGNSRPMLITLLGAVAALLLVACANLASLALARAASRQRELAVRSALGASRSQLVRLLLAESAVLAFAGGTLGLCLAAWGSATLIRFVPTTLPRIQGLAIDFRVLLFTSSIVLVVALVCGLAPAWWLSRTDLRSTLAGAGRGQSAGVGQARLRRWLVAGQVGLALLLLATAGLFLRSFAQLSKQDPGFDPKGVLSVRLSLPQPTYPDRAGFVGFYEKLLPRLAALPGVESTGVISLLPLGFGHAGVNFELPDQPVAKADRPVAHFRIIAPGYVPTMRIPLLEGRNFTDEDKADRNPVALISAPIARKFFKDHSPIGRRILVDDNDTAPRPVEIVGVVGDVKQTNLESEATFDIYLPLQQMQEVSVQWLRNNSFVVVRTSIAPLSLQMAVRNEIRNVDAAVPATNVRTMEDVMARALATRRFSLLMVGLFAASALFLAAAGLYAVIAYGIGQRTREIGLRLALGATRVQILKLILGEGFRLVLSGIVLGFAATLVLIKLIASQLYGVSAHDPVSFSFVTVLLAGISLLACWMAAWRAMRIDPAIALQAD